MHMLARLGALFTLAGIPPYTILFSVRSKALEDGYDLVGLYQ
jgi:hypothetical protein